MVAKKPVSKTKSFEDKLWSTAELLRGMVAPSAYKDIALGLLFLKFISYWYDQRRAELEDCRNVSLVYWGSRISKIQRCSRILQNSQNCRH